MALKDHEVSLVEAITRKAKNNRLLAWLIVGGACVIGLSSFSDAVVKMVGFPKRIIETLKEPEGQQTSPGQIVIEPRPDVEYWKALLCARETTPILDTNRSLSTLTDEEQIRLLIEAEGQAAVQKDVFRHVSLFRKDALFREPGRDWSGCEAITRRAVTLFRQIRFLLIREEVVTLEIHGVSAVATTRHKEEYVREWQGLEGSGRQKVFELKAQTKWSFLKDRGIWRIYTFVGDSRSVPQGGPS